MLCCDDVRRHLSGADCNLITLQGFKLAYIARRVAIIAYFDTLTEPENLKGVWRYDAVLHMLINSVGERLQDERRNREAISWFKKCVEMCEEGRFKCEDNLDIMDKAEPFDRLDQSLFNLGSAYEKIEMFVEALGSYSRAYNSGGAQVESAHEKRVELLQEMGEWNGTIGDQVSDP